MILVIEIMLFIIQKVNFSLDIVLTDRFIRERKLLRQLESSMSESELQRQPQQQQQQQQQPQLVAETRGKRHGLSRLNPIELIRDTIEDVRYMLEYNNLKLRHLLMFLTNLGTIIVRTLMSICYMSRPRVRDQTTGEYQDRVLKFLESIYLVDVLNQTDSSGMLHRLSLMVLMTFLAQRLSSFYFRIQVSKLNRHKYVQLDAMQLNMGYLKRLSVESMVGLFRMLSDCMRHECNLKFALRDGRAKRLRMIGNRLNKLARIDRQYYYNQISYNECYEPIKELQVDESDRNPIYAPKPIHRFDPMTLFFMITLSIVSVSAMGLTPIVATSVIIWPDLLACGLSPSSYDQLTLAAIIRAAYNYLSEPKLVAGTVQIVTLTSIMAINMNDLAIIVNVALSEVSRANLVVKMLELERDHHRSYLRDFIKYLAINRFEILDFELLSEPTMGLKRQQQRQYRPFRDIKRGHWSVSEHVYDRVEDPLRRVASNSGTINQQQQPLASRGSTLKSRHFDLLVSDFRHNLSEHIEHELNCNVKYLVDLIKGMQSELADMKSHFTRSINLSIMSGTLGLSFTSSMLIEQRSIQYSLVTSICGICFLLPLTVSLITGAASENGFRKINRALMPLMVNELRLIDRDVVIQLQKVHRHSSIIKNRSFMILGNLPLTFGSLPSIIGWIATCILLLQRFISLDTMSSQVEPSLCGNRERLN